jgi:peroxin-6
MYALCSDAMLKAITRQARLVDEKVAAINAERTANPMSIAYFFDHLAADEDTAVMVREEDFVEAHRELVPSVSADELLHYERVRSTFEGKGKKDGAKGNGEEPRIDRKGKGKAVEPLEGGDVDALVVQMGDVDVSGSGSGKGKGKASASHARESSLDIAEGGFGSAADGDEELYS